MERQHVKASPSSYSLRWMIAAVVPQAPVDSTRLYSQSARGGWDTLEATIDQVPRERRPA
jgi:hypothetical protein